MIDDERRCAVHVERDVTHDADDLERRAATSRDTLPDDGVERHAWKRDSGKIAAHDHARWHVAVVTCIEGAAGTHWNLQSREDIPADDALLDVEPVFRRYRSPG